MSTSHSQIVGAMIGLLKAVPAVASGRVHRSRTRAIGVEQPNAVVVRLERSASQLAAVQGGPTSWTTLISVECYGRAAGAVPDAEADAVAEAVFARLASDPTLGAMAMGVEPLEGDTLSWDVDELDTNLACITARFVVRHQTTGRTLT